MLHRGGIFLFFTPLLCVAPYAAGIGKGRNAPSPQADKRMSASKARKANDCPACQTPFCYTWV